MADDPNCTHSQYLSQMLSKFTLQLGKGELECMDVPIATWGKVPIDPSSEDSSAAQAREEFQNCKPRLHHMFESSVDIGMMGFDRRILDACPALCCMRGMPMEPLIGQTPTVVIRAEDSAQST